MLILEKYPSFNYFSCRIQKIRALTDWKSHYKINPPLASVNKPDGIGILPIVAHLLLLALLQTPQHLLL